MKLLSELISYFFSATNKKSLHRNIDFLHQETQIIDSQNDRVKRDFKAQINDLRVMSLVPHALDCEDIFSCKKNPCVSQEPMKISKSKKSKKALQADMARSMELLRKDLAPITTDDLGDMKEFLRKDD